MRLAPVSFASLAALLSAAPTSAFVVPLPATTTAVRPSSDHLLRHPPRLSSTPTQNESDAAADTEAAVATPLERQARASECDDANTPPTLQTLIQTLSALKSGSDIRGRYTDHARVGSLVGVVHELSSRPDGSPPPLTPFAAYCYGHAFGEMVKAETGREEDDVVVCVGRDPRPHGVRLADAFARGAEGVDGVRVVYTGLATTPAMFHFCKADLCDGSAMITASHLPEDRNGIKLFTKTGGGFTHADVDALIDGAASHARHWHDVGVVPPTSGDGAVQCSGGWVDYMPQYGDTLRDAIVREVCGDDNGNGGDASKKPLSGLRIVLNAGNGAGYFFNDILSKLGADVSHSMGLQPDGTFPTGVPNPENKAMIELTTNLCEGCDADMGIMLDTDADRSGFIVPRTVDAATCTKSDYEPLGRNRLIALLSTIFARTSPGCTIVTDSVTSEGLATFVEKDLGLKHYRYLKGYANVIGKAREITEGSGSDEIAEMAIETSGHCAMRENGYLDDGTYTAVKVIGLLARVARSGDGSSLLDLIADLDEMPVEDELRMSVGDGSLESTESIFQRFSGVIEAHTSGDGKVKDWSLDEDNLEGIRVRTGGGGFFMLRKSLHDPLISLQVEASDEDEVRSKILSPILAMIESELGIINGLDVGVLRDY